MTWYAVRTMPGAQHPQREYAVEPTGSKRGKGYRIVPSLNPNVSAVERALREAGFVCYMPVEKRLIRDRRKPDLWKARRFALLLGYVFVKGPCNFYRLIEVPGIAGIVGTNGDPKHVDLMDILMLRKMEAESESEFDRRAINTQRSIRRKAKLHGDKKLKALVDNLNALGTTTIAVGSELLVA